jgi:plastocyanin
MRVVRPLPWCPALLAGALWAVLAVGCGTGKEMAGPGPEAAAPEAEAPAPPEAMPEAETAAPEPAPAPEAPALPPAAPELAPPGTAPAPPPQPAAAAPAQPAPGAAFELHFPEEATAQAPPPRSEPETYEVFVPDQNYAFVPRLLTIYEGDTVVWHNKSGVVHLFATIPGSDPTGFMEIEPSDLLVGARVAHTFTKAGQYPYFCFIHNQMTGKIIVLPRSP